MLRRVESQLGNVIHDDTQVPAASSQHHLLTLIIFTRVYVCVVI